MLKSVSTRNLKEHHKNGYYFTDIEGEKYSEVRRSIEQYGIRDPIKITTDYIVISGHQRLRIARDIGMDKVPVEMIPELNEDEVEYLLIAENVERRGQAETDPIKKSRIANFLKEYWDICHGGSRGQNDLLKTNKDIGNFINSDERTTKRIMKLHDLIPELQQLVSEGKLGTTSAEQLSYMTEENQQALVDVLGEEIEKTTVAKAKEYRSTEKDSADTEEYEKKIKELQRQAEQYKRSEEIARKQLEEEQNKEPKVIEKEVIKEIDNTDYERIEQLQKEISIVKRELDEKNIELGEVNSNNEDLNRLKEDLNKLHRTKDNLLKGIDTAKEVGEVLSDVSYCSESVIKLRRSKLVEEIKESNSLKKIVIQETNDLVKDLLSLIDDLEDLDSNVIDAEIVV